VGLFLIKTKQAAFLSFKALTKGDS